MSHEPTSAPEEHPRPVEGRGPSAAGPSPPTIGPSPPTLAPAGSPTTKSSLGIPSVIGRYRVLRVLGEGNFGRVFLAYDDELHRDVAIKMPLPERVSRPEDVEDYLNEARTLASLSHPNIVAVFDAGRTEYGHCFVVSKFIEGTDLARRLQQSRPSFVESAGLVAVVAEALHHAHRHALVHRDVKPGNILIAADGTPYLADFGLALKDAEFGKGTGFAGTPAYMSPEQAKGEGHRVDGRSDIFSLGVVFYEMLARRRPFEAGTLEELLEQIANLDARPPRQIDDAVPRELDRICLKAMSKRATDRYSTAKDLADDLTHFLNDGSTRPTTSLGSVASLPPQTTAPLPATDSTSSHSRPIKIVPKGLRSFDAHDADFFLELLPGPRDRDGLPDILRFWKTRIEVTDIDASFTVGLIYGPSGCGKSSMVKAGLLPRLADSVIPVYLEATADETETRLLSGLRKRCPSLPADLPLKSAIAALRRGQGVPAGKKVLIVLDQFEQWLHAQKNAENVELVQALRQCDGEHVQAVVMVRDDFWMAATRFLRELEIQLLEGQNSAAVDLFPVRHAEKVLASFGRAFGCLPEKPGDMTAEQKQFLSQAVAGVSQGGKVISVRLSLFAEMMKGKAWTPAALKAVGGTEGVGVTFLEETFGATTAPPANRYHLKAVRGVLKALLPESGADIKGHMRSRAVLLEASGYAGRPRDFDDLLRILDTEIRLLTPTDPAGQPDEVSPPVDSGQKYYQLTHDYLVQSLRDWLTRKQKETRRGRAEILLADRSAAWNGRPEDRHLPSLLQWARIRLLTPARNWSTPQRRMMTTAARFHAVRVVLIALLLGLFGWGVYESHGQLVARGLRDRLLDADTADVPAIVAEMPLYRRWLDPMLRADRTAKGDGSEQHLAASPDLKTHRERLNLSLALLPVDPKQVDFLKNRLFTADPAATRAIRDALVPYGDELVPELWTAAEDSKKRLHATAALALYDPRNPKWKVQSAGVAHDLVKVPAVYLLTWMDALRSIKAELRDPVAEIYRDPRRSDTERSLATDILKDFAGDQPEFLTDLLLDGDPVQFATMYELIDKERARVVPVLKNALDKIPDDAANIVKERLAKRQANAAIALLRMDRPQFLWPLLRHSPDPRVRSFLVHRLGPMGADLHVLVGRLDDEKDVTARRALLLSLGEWSPEHLKRPDQESTADEWKSLVSKIELVFRDDPDPGIHAASRWLLRSWGDLAWLESTNKEVAANSASQEARLRRFESALADRSGKPDPTWYVNRERQTLVLIPGPVELEIGSPPTEAGREGGAEAARRSAKEDFERQAKKRIARSFAIGAELVTVEQYLRFRKDHVYERDYSPTPDSPVNKVTWYDAAAYCIWLSEQEGIPKEQWCYLPNADGQFAAGMSLAPDYLKKTGYRLPTEAEWEYACRAGARTSRFYGEGVELLGKYAWYTKASEDAGMLPGAADRLAALGKSFEVKARSVKPNDLGLFDILGNAWEWCQNRVLPYESGDDLEEDLEVREKDTRPIRGGCFYTQARYVRAAFRDRGVPSYLMSNNGFRVARTIAPRP